MPISVRENVPLAPLTTLGVGGCARYLVEAASADDVCSAVEWAKSRKLPLFVLGGGSNVLVSDTGFPGLVVRIVIRGIMETNEGLFTVGAGEEWDALVARAVGADFGGIECLSGIPGTVGGTPVQNVGAYGQEVSETIASVDGLDLRDLNRRTFSNSECGFAYRQSVFNTTQRGRWIILGVTYQLRKGAPPKIAYRDLKEYFAARNVPSPSLQLVRDAVREVRRSKAMLIVPGDDDSRSAGSFFKNPVLAPAAYERLLQIASQRGEKIPSYPAEGQSYKVPAAWLVEHAGFTKGTTRGTVGISRKHALAIVNRGGAAASDVLALKNEIQRRVRETFGIELVPEPVMVGFDGN